MLDILILWDELNFLKSNVYLKSTFSYKESVSSLSIVRDISFIVQISHNMQILGEHIDRSLHFKPWKVQKNEINAY